MKLGISSYAYSKLLKSKEMDLFDVIKKTKEIGYDAIEFSNLPAEGDEKLQLAKLVKKACDQEGLSIVNYATPADLLTGSDGNIQNELKRIKKEVHIAKALGVDKMRHDATFGFNASDPTARSFYFNLDKLASACHDITTYANELGIKTMVENHGLYSQDSDRIELLVNEVDHDNFGVLLDVGNFMCVDEDPVRAMGRLITYAFHIHFKDFHVKSGNSFNPGEGWFGTRYGNYLRGAIIGHGDAPLAQCINIMKTYNYQGTLSIEFEGMEDTLLGCTLGYKNLKRLVKKDE
ncbi:MAG: sugar phosphate isomerase/epimerase [Clostridiales bacterium]|nr:sugar phosphate isomerase/epimerase [Clostridiales bacterium]